MAGNAAIGLDIGTTAVRAAQVSVSRGQAVLEHFGQVALPPGAVVDGQVVAPELVAAALRELWAGGKFSTRRVVLGVANQKVIVRQVDLPWMPLDQLKASLRYQVADLVPMPVEDAVLDFVVLDEVERDTERRYRGLLVATAEDMVLGAVQAAQLARLRPVSVDLTPFALLRALGSRDTLAPPEVLVDVGARVTNIVVHEAGVPRFVRVLLLGGDMVTDALVGRLGIGIPAAEELKRDGVPDDGSAAAKQALASATLSFVDEVLGSVNYYLATSGSRPPSRVVLTGGGSLLSGLAEHLADALHLPVQGGTAFVGMQVAGTRLAPEQLAFVEPMAAVPVGLALGGPR